METIKTVKLSIQNYRRTVPPQLEVGLLKKKNLLAVFESGQRSIAYA